MRLIRAAVALIVACIAYVLLALAVLLMGRPE